MCRVGEKMAGGEKDVKLKGVSGDGVAEQEGKWRTPSGGRRRGRGGGGGGLGDRGGSARV